MRRDWNERRHPRWPSGSGRNSGRFRESGSSRWVQRLSADVGRVFGQSGPDQIGRDRGDGTRSVTGQELSDNPHLGGQIEIMDVVGNWHPIREIRPYRGGLIHEVYGSDEYHQFLGPQQDYIVKPLGGITDEDRFFELRMQMGDESDELAYQMWLHPQRYENKFEVRHPTTGQWGVIRRIDEIDADDDDEAYGAIAIESDDFVFYLRTPDDGDGVDYGTVTVRPAGAP